MKLLKYVCLNHKSSPFVSL